MVEGGKHLATTRHHLDKAGLSTPQWRRQWVAARWRITTNGSPDEPFGNLTITVSPDGQVSIRLPKQLEQLANAPAAGSRSPAPRCSPTALANGPNGSPAATPSPAVSPPTWP